MKLCYACQKNKNESDFYKDEYSDDGYTSSCRDCQKAKSKAYYKTVRDALTDKQKEARRKAYALWKENHPERYKELTIKNNEKRRLANKTRSKTSELLGEGLPEGESDEGGILQGD